MSRYAVPMKDGSTVWLPEEAYQRYLKGELDLENPKQTPERQQRLEEARRLMRKDFGLPEK